MKESLRLDMRRVRRALSSERRAHASRAASAHLLALPELTGASIVAVYAAMHSEPSPAHAAQALVQRHVTVVYPRVCAGESALRFHDVADAAELRVGGFGIPTPVPERHPEIDVEHIDVIVVPGLGFDRNGHRLGWGAGYYDITLARCPAVRVAFALQCQVLDEIPSDPHDMPMDLLITEVGVVRVSERARAKVSDRS